MATNLAHCAGLSSENGEGSAPPALALITGLNKDRLTNRSYNTAIGSDLTPSNRDSIWPFAVAVESLRGSQTQAGDLDDGQRNVGEVRVIFVQIALASEGFPLTRSASR